MKEKTIRDLCKRVASMNGLEIDNESVIVYQDLIGHATLEENYELANDPALMESFYRIYGVAYGTIAAIKFYMTNSKKVIELNAELEYQKNKVDELNVMLKSSHKEEEFWRSKSDEYKEALKEKEATIKATTDALEAQVRENTELKARLYDMLEKGTL